MAEASVSYSLKYNARVLVPAPAVSVNSKWIVGTNALREENEVLVLQHDPDNERLVCTHTYNHPSEVWDLAPCPTSEDLFLTVWSKGGNFGVSLWHTSSDSQDLQQQAELTGHTTIIRSVLWHPVQNDQVVTIEEGFVKMWSITEAGVECTSTAAAGEMQQLWTGVLHPRNDSCLCTAGGNNMQVWDLRAPNKPSAEVVQAHKMPIRSLSFAPHGDTRIVTAGDDCKLRFWDLRMVSKSPESLLDLGGHSHWVWRAAYNPSYSQLIASSSSDSLVNLYYTPQLAASAGAPGSGSGDAPAAPAVTRAGDLDGKAHTFDEHEDSVYGLAWSMSDPWLFASLSYDGRVVVNKVPKNIKYKILI